ncbi:hypothetical protein [Deinococcus aerius]|uniref:hypothetical protein n=1 Tax=Deinococcus aerius TaxID=200253 RepID=UPI00105729C7|nr:hypothetical protein [Deinococcus aerius]
MTYVRAALVIVGVIAALWVTFFHPPLVLTAGPGDYADARAHCGQSAQQIVGQQTGEFDDLFPESAARQKAPYSQEFHRCMSNASVRTSQLLIQLAVIAVSTAALLWATRFLK